MNGFLIKPSKWIANNKMGFAGLKKEKDRNVLGRLFSKLVTLRHVHMYQTISKKKMFKEWLSVLYYGAKKEFSDTNGPFIKIY